MAVSGGRSGVLAAFFMLCICQTCILGARPAPANSAAVKNLVAALQQTGIFSTSLGYMQRDGNAGVLAFVSQVLDSGSVTIFLPTDNAWKGVGPSKTRSLSQKNQLAQVFKYHMVRQFIPSRTLINAQPGSLLLTIEGSLLAKEKPNDQAKQNIIIGVAYKGKIRQQQQQEQSPAKGQTPVIRKGVVVQPDIYLDAANKVAIHGFNAVLFPPDY